jgi:hypothetical protein
MAVVPLLFLTSLLMRERSNHLHQALAEKVTPHPLTAIE